ncbi:MAG: GHKL domain-containing protein [Cyclobacteriaceae bacterium]|nr:GHKL domain-containing protein [Cyclobacteriaceae bacterium]
MRVYLNLILLIQVLIVTTNIRAQQRPASFPPSKPLSQSSIDQWTSDAGLISNNLTGVIQGDDGFLWITAYNGLLRFDGYRFELFDRDNTSFLKSDAFYQPYKEGNKLWLATQGSGIVVYENNTLKPYQPKEGALPSSIRCLLVTDSTMYVGSNNNGLFILRNEIIEKPDFDPISNTSIMALAIDTHGSIWVGTNGNGVVKIKNGAFSHYTTKNGLAGNVINALYATSDGRILIGSTNGLDVLENDRISSVALLQNIQVNALTMDSYGSVWAATERGLARINEAAGTEELFTKTQGLPTLELTSLTFDKEGSLWLTTSKAGLLRLKDTGIVTYSEANGLSLDLVNTIAEGNKGELYIGTDGGGIDVFINGKFSKLDLKHSLNNIGIRDICVDNDILWIGSYSGLLRKQGNQETLYNISTGLPAQDIRRILKDKNGDLWLATRAGGAMVFSDGKVKSVYNKESGLGANYILSIEQDANGTLYLGTNGGGLTLIDTTGKLSTHHITDDDSGVLIFNIHIDKRGRIWLVANTGIFHFTGQDFIQLELEHQVKGESYFDWVEDNAGNVWITTNKGILRIRKDEAVNYAQNKNTPIKTRLYNNYDGMKNKECTGATRATLSSTGEVWIPTIGGASVINPERMIENPIIPPVYITRLITDNQTFLKSGQPKIQSDNIRYTFQFTSLSLVAPGQNHFKFILDGFDKQWVDGGLERETSYTNLPPGEYTFRVIASNNDELWNTTGAEFRFRVKPFFYETKWFYIVLALLVAGSLFGIYKWRVNDIEKRNRELKKVNSELDKFVYSASHDLRAPLASVLGLVNVARLSDGKDIPLYLDLIEKSIQRLDGFIRDIIDFSRNARLEIIREEISFNTLIHEVMDDLRFLDHKNRILRIVTVNGHGAFHTDSRRLKIILTNLISNAIKYHNLRQENPFIEVKVDYDDNHAIIQVIDNGSGIAEHHLMNIFKMFYRANENIKGSGLGLYIVHETVDKLEGEITVSSKIDKGTTFLVNLPAIKKQTQ